VTWLLSAGYRGCPPDVARQWHGRRVRTWVAPAGVGVSSRAGEARPCDHLPRWQVAEGDAAGECGLWVMSRWVQVEAEQPRLPFPAVPDR
jgi:hypothetical protein